MIELGQFERRNAEFDRCGVHVVVVSLEAPEDSQKTQADFPHLLVLADHDRALASAAGMIHENSGPGGSATSAPTTVLVDRSGIVRWLYRPPSAISRLSPDDVLDAIDRFLPAG